MNFRNHICGRHVPPVLCERQSVAGSCQGAGAIGCHQRSTIRACSVSGLERRLLLQRKMILT